MSRIMATHLCDVIINGLSLERKKKENKSRVGRIQYNTHSNANYVI